MVAHLQLLYGAAEKRMTLAPVSKLSLLHELVPASSQLVVPCIFLALLGDPLVGHIRLLEGWYH